ncbi:hypothetical protein A3C98_01475 [Candidatus Roizmanbacteria bacterium RIFCSPHIGHO2_02_FULL_37_15]|uniref:rRNA maturation RNase YbeY n=1 Tax=Candidatus Roizmanbacteria bacterium RIFCSPLOWO2_01_FULL_37_16 TaxID=1802058 RepID=A0A1F7IQN0_9BACT|nr:MAG: hypothetical protein A3C98_01475 [Candidatus Roizmanbacteria bacterium RIFCSPHIGHO2_02_FULL_37_15]OGK32747.1 MAG: hypothetical protein A3F57_02120 [Candidatus Roizmanbacteria bacterium RIFCSPHIGHO2_12_FULL_36_11]OGK45622.1 MAG: hypothetical protein A3B40_00315 [Candidatus Roizmanbacteria bacterium RIFCSPLOWO2_01_FULL_37_16]OGK56644.1 MAG: hypothetical protein A3I50_01230 [Candidatus Roizmanbacteria bacterium RIFCSPLOWO2_02_FULL_37_9]
MINIISSSRYKINRKLLKQEMNKILKNYGIPDNALFNLIFVGKKKMKTIASQYKKENAALPVLSFSYLDKNNTFEKEDPLGEIFICYPLTILLAAERERKVDVIISQLVKHGIDNILR